MSKKQKWVCNNCSEKCVIVLKEGRNPANICIFTGLLTAGVWDKEEKKCPQCKGEKRIVVTCNGVISKYKEQLVVCGECMGKGVV